MNTVKFEKQNVKMIAHRGLRGIEPENSTAAFIAAGNRSYYGIESDVHATIDGWFVVIHDSSSGRVADKNLKIRKNIFTALREASLFNRDGSLSDLKIPTLSEYIKICKRYEKTAFLELKNAFPKKQLEQIVRIIQKLGHLESTVFISYHLANLKAIRGIRPNQPLQFLSKRVTPRLVEELRALQIDLDLHYKKVTREVVRLVHENGLLLNCWTCNDPVAAATLAEMGVDYITTDILE